MTITLPVILKSNTPCRPELVSGSIIQFYELFKLNIKLIIKNYGRNFSNANRHYRIAKCGEIDAV